MRKVREPLRIVEEVLSRSSSDPRGRHGEGHWRRVAAASLALCDFLPEVDRRIAFFFGLFHDSMCPPGGHASHAPRGAGLAEELLEGVLPAEDLELLVAACTTHMGRERSSDPTVAVCWDGDRLNIWRVGRRPAASFLSTEAARSPGMIEWAKALQERRPPSWGELWEKTLERRTRVSEVGKAEGVYMPLRIRRLFSEHPAARRFSAEQIAGALLITGLVEELPEAFEVEEALEVLESAADYPLYVRFGDLPAGGKSSTWRKLAVKRGLHPIPEGDYEGGVSCFRARRDEDGYELCFDNDQLEAMFYTARLENRGFYLVTGDEVGLGMDGEPVLANAEIVERLEIDWDDEAAERHESGHYADQDLLVVRMTLRRSTSADSGAHGNEHWKRVAAAALMLCNGVPDADPRIAFYFALFHDSMRLGEYGDPGHGERGAELAREIIGDHLPAGYWSEEELEILEYACAHHDSGQVSTDPTIGVCWDADRLNLWRVGKRPDPDLLSTGAAVEMIERSKRLEEERFTWMGLDHWYATQTGRQDL